MKRIAFGGLLVAFSLTALCGVALAHGLHAPVEPRFHAAAHVLPFVGAATLAIVGSVWVWRRRRGVSK